MSRRREVKAILDQKRAGEAVQRDPKARACKFMAFRRSCAKRRARSCGAVNISWTISVAQEQRGRRAREQRGAVRALVMEAPPRKSSGTRRRTGSRVTRILRRMRAFTGSVRRSGRGHGGPTALHRRKGRVVEGYGERSRRTPPVRTPWAYRIATSPENTAGRRLRVSLPAEERWTAACAGAVGH